MVELVADCRINWGCRLADETSQGEYFGHRCMPIQNVMLMLWRQVYFEDKKLR